MECEPQRLLHVDSLTLRVALFAPALFATVDSSLRRMHCQEACINTFVSNSIRVFDCLACALVCCCRTPRTSPAAGAFTRLVPNTAQLLMYCKILMYIRQCRNVLYLIANLVHICLQTWCIFVASLSLHNFRAPTPPPYLTCKVHKILTNIHENTMRHCSVGHALFSVSAGQNELQYSTRNWVRVWIARGSDLGDHLRGAPNTACMSVQGLDLGHA